MKIEDFKKKMKPKKDSELKKFQNEILELIHAKYSHESISIFLNQNGVKTSRRNVSKFIKNLDTKQIPKKEIPKIEEKQSTISTNEMKQIKEENTQKVGIQFPKLQRVGKDTEIKDTPDWAK